MTISKVSKKSEKKKKKNPLHKQDHYKENLAMASSPLLEAVLFPFVKQICFGASKIHNLRTAVSLGNREEEEEEEPVIKYFQLKCDDDVKSSVQHDTYVFLLDGALFTVVGIRYSRSSADDAASLIGAVVTLVTDSHQRARPHVGVADHAFPIAWEEEEG